MAIPSDVALLLDYARAEAKRRGHGQVVLAHIAAALSSKNAEQFAATFGASAQSTLKSALEQLPLGRGVVADAPELGELLGKISAGPNTTELLNEAIRKLLEGVPASVPTPVARQAAAGQHEPAIDPAPVQPPVAPSTAPRPSPIDKVVLLRQLKSRIVGQDEALETIVNRPGIDAHAVRPAANPSRWRLSRGRTQRHRQVGARTRARRTSVWQRGAPDQPRHERVRPRLGRVAAHRSAARLRRLRQARGLANDARPSPTGLAGPARRDREEPPDGVEHVPAGVQRRPADGRAGQGGGLLARR